ncbi:MAG: 6-phosphogluconolactonase [Marinoscillum sp.]
MTKDQIKSYKSPQLTAEAFGDYLVEKAREKNDQFHVALSGGSTPKILFDYLVKNYKDDPIWSEMHFYWGDERCVPPTDDDSNFKMTKERLFDHLEIDEAQIHRVFGEDDPSEEAERYSSELVEFMPTKKGIPIFDLIILGMGEDGHTASIFPHQIELLESDKVCDVATHPISGQLRVTLTGHVINAAEEVVFLVTGAGKQPKIFEIFHRSGEWHGYPAAHISPLSGKLLWFVDEAAVAGV